MIVMNIAEAREQAKPRGTPRISKPRVRIEEPLVKKQRRKPDKPRQSQYARLPFFFVSEPATFGFDVLETSIVAALIRGAHAKRHDDHYKEALEFAARMHGRKPAGPIKQSWMSKSHYEKMEELRQLPATDVIFDTNRVALLKLAMVSCGRPNWQRVTEALEHFLEVPDGPIEQYQPRRDGTLRICVSRKWLARGNWRYIPVPLPTRSLIATNLALFLSCISGKKVVGIRVATLSRKIGIKLKTQFAQRQSIKRACKQVNAAVFRNIMQTRPNIEKADHLFFYEPEFIGDDRVRFKRSSKPDGQLLVNMLAGEKGYAEGPWSSPD
jgi:hypothetical protein